MIEGVDVVEERRRELPSPIVDRGVGRRREAESTLALDSLLFRPVLLDGVRVGTVVDVVLNSSCARVIGVDVAHRGTRSFIPWIALRTHIDALTLTSAEPLCRRNGPGLLLARGTRLSTTCHRATLVVDRDGVIGSGRGRIGP